MRNNTKTVKICQKLFKISPKCRISPNLTNTGEILTSEGHSTLVYILGSFLHHYKLRMQRVDRLIGRSTASVQHKICNQTQQQSRLEPKSSSKVEQMGALNFCLHAVGSFIHLRHAGAGLQNFIHLHHLAALEGYVHSSKN